MSCRNLITNALRKKHFYKEAIRIEPISSDEISGIKEPVSVDWLKWDPISSGEGDLQLDDMEKSFSATTRVSKTAKAIDFSEVFNSMASNGANYLTSIQATETPVATSGVTEKPGGFGFLLETDQTSSYNTSLKNHTYGDENFQEKNLPSDDTRAFTNSEGIRNQVSTTKDESKNSNVMLPSIVDERHDVQSEKNIRSCENVSMNEDVMEMDVKDQEGIQVTEKVSSGEKLGESGDDSTTIVDYIPHLVAADDTKVENVSSVANNLEVMMDEEDACVTKNVSGGEQIKESGDEMIALADHIPLSVTSDGMIGKDVLSFAIIENLEKLPVEEQEHGDADTRSILVVDDDLKVKDDSSDETCMSLEEVRERGQMHEEQTYVESKHTASVPFLSGRSRANRRTSHQQPSFPLKRLLNPMAFKMRTKKFKRKG
ncbi:unnamed protein product [Dovyalis caffra]|uniref:Uncharacterized protein n=1 Tax=Dovyalis caffra TaxID=77055 RepID=A0AAV1RAM3_9ROSI|nr:unnamed protein product [Dovyalis caffra]